MTTPVDNAANRGSQSHAHGERASRLHEQALPILAGVCDLNGIMRGKRLPPGKVRKALDGELKMPLSSIGADVWGTDVMGNRLVIEAGDRDGVLGPIGRGPYPMDWLANPTSLLPLSMELESGEPFPGDPRHALAGVLRRYEARGLCPVAAIEIEFYLVDPCHVRATPPRIHDNGARADFDAIYSVDEVEHFAHFLDALYRACETFEIKLDSAVSECGPGQFEVNMAHTANVMRAADDAYLFKRVAKSVARSCGLAACYMAKPYADRSGSGMHVHLSLLDAAGSNVFDDGGPHGTVALRHAVAGMLTAMPDCMVMFAPHLNSYRRFAPGSLAPTLANWGYDNRTAALRVPVGSCKSRRIEHRVAGADANPYLVLAATLGAALAGIEAEASAPEAVTGNAYQAGGVRLPSDWRSAIDAFAGGPAASAIVHPTLVAMFTALKRQELSVFSERVTDFEYATYLGSV